MLYSSETTYKMNIDAILTIQKHWRKVKSILHSAYWDWYSNTIEERLGPLYSIDYDGSIYDGYNEISVGTHIDSFFFVPRGERKKYLTYIVEAAKTYYGTNTYKN